MRKRQWFVAILTLLVAVGVQAAEGMVKLQSAHSVAETTDRLEQALSAAGFRIFARVDHAAGARSVDMALPDTQLLIFGNPKGGTVLMQSQQTIGIDLPLKYLVWQDAGGKVMIGWNDPTWLAGRHAITDRAKPVEKMTGALRKFASEAAQR